MDHEYWDLRLQAYIDGEMGPADRIAMERHLTGCDQCQANAAYFKSLKERLQAHCESVEIPHAVDERLRRIARRQGFRMFRRAWVQGTLAAAAVVVISLLIPRFYQTPYQFVDQILTGQVVCHDCHIAERANLGMGDICQDGHRMGLVAEDGTVYRIARDEIGAPVIKDMSLYGSQVRIYGQVLAQENLIRVKRLEKIARQAALLEGSFVP